MNLLEWNVSLTFQDYAFSLEKQLCTFNIQIIVLQYTGDIIGKIVIQLQDIGFTV